MPVTGSDAILVPAQARMKWNGGVLSEVVDLVEHRAEAAVVDACEQQDLVAEDAVPERTEPEHEGHDREKSHGQRGPVPGHEPARTFH